MPNGTASTTIGTKLYHNLASPIEIPDMQEFPDLFGKPDFLDTTTMGDTSKTSVPGLTDPGEMKFVFLYTGMGNGTAYKILNDLKTAGVPAPFKVVLANGDYFTFSAYVTINVDGKKVNEVNSFTATLAPSTAISGSAAVTTPHLTFVCQDATSAGATKITSVSPTLTGGNSYMYKFNCIEPSAGDDLTGLGWKAYTLGADIVVENNNIVTLAEVSTGDVVVKTGAAISVVS